ncbi:MAG: hypothetical protein SFW35_04130 [Chitinophagales bacterium]|nr:hypothetical protein [Chitinophagales bacterium]
MSKEQTGSDAYITTRGIEGPVGLTSTEALYGDEHYTYNKVGVCFLATGL